MAKKRKTSGGGRAAKSGRREDSPQEVSPKSVFASPFKDLKKLLIERAVQIQNEIPAPTPLNRVIKPPPVIAPRQASAPVDEAAALREAYAGVRPLGPISRRRIPRELRVTRAIVSEEAEVLAALSDLVSGQRNFDLTETEEYVEGTRVGINPRLTGQLRRGKFAIQAHIDLHGMIQVDAKQALTEFIIESVHKGFCTVLVVHGRGLGSPGGRPVLKHAAAEWLSHGTIGAHVLAFTTSRPQDGGAGAMYVLLRRDRRRAPFEVLQGAKRRD